VAAEYTLYIAENRESVTPIPHDSDDAETKGYFAVGYVTDPRTLTRYYRAVFARADDHCWVLK